MTPLQGKIVLITGAAQRIGRSLALAVARAGADVVVHFNKSRAQAESLQTQIQDLGRNAYLLNADLYDAEQVAGLLSRTQRAGTLYALVNNASIFEPYGWHDTTIETWNRHLMVNLTAPFLLSQAFARHLPPENTGRIINLLDWRALRPGADHLPYTISKAALAALTRSLAIALAPRIMVNGLALGAILPPSDRGDDEKITQNIPAQRWAELEELDQALIFLLTGPSYITGEIIHLDGGRHLL